MTKRSMFSLAAGLVLATLVGCGLQKGETLFTTGPAVPPVMGAVPADGTYSVYTAASPNPTGTYSLHKGDPLGFQKLDSGEIDAVAGTNHVHLGILTIQAYWKQL